MIDVLGAPFDAGGACLGSRLGPQAIEVAGLVEAFAALGLDVRGWKNLAVSPSVAEGGLIGFEACLAAVAALKTAVAASISRGDTPVVLGGDHAVAMGSVAGARSAATAEPAVVWIDAHADANTPGGSATGRLHGMPLAALFGLPSGAEGERDRQWRRLLEAVAAPVALAPSNVAWLGLRDVDPGERALLGSSSESLVLTMFDFDRLGVVEIVSRLAAWLRGRGADEVWLSFDVDVLDPALAPGTGTAVKGGLTYREAHLTAELLHELFAHAGGPRLLGVDVVETNPLRDVANSTAVFAVEWLSSLFGKTILGGKR